MPGPETNPQSPASRRIPGDVITLACCFLFLGTLSLLGAVATDRPSLRLTMGAFTAIHYLVAMGLFRLRPWARVTSGVLLLVSFGLSLLSLRTGIGFNKVFRVCFSLGWAVYIFAPSTKRLFLSTAVTRFSLAGALNQGANLLCIIPLIVLALVFHVPVWLTSVSILVLLGIYTVYWEDRVSRWLTARLAPRPADLDAASWTVVRTALRARERGDLDVAGQLLTPLADSLTVGNLRGLLVMDRALQSEGLLRVLYDATWVAPPSARPHVVQALESCDLPALVEQRARLVAGLLEDEAQAHSVFLEETDALLQKITGQTFVANTVFQHREAWLRGRSLCTGSQAHTWLTVRLLDAQVLAAANQVALRSGEPSLGRLTEFSLRLDEAGSGNLTAEWIVEHAPTLCVAPVLSDVARLLYLDSPFVKIHGNEVFAQRLTARVELITLLSRLWRDYAEDSRIEVPYLLARLTGRPDRHRSWARFDAWWRKHRAHQEAFDCAFVAGLDAARRGEWDHAERAFGEAGRAWPERTCAAYNRGLALLQIDRDPEAEVLFTRLAQEEPEESLFWMRLGDAQRSQRKLAAAIEAYQRAASLGDLGQGVALRLGITLAADGREAEAERALAKSAGENADADRLEALSAFLESEGIYRLASRYRERAFLQRLGEKTPESEDAEEEGDAGDGEEAGAL